MNEDEIQSLRSTRHEHSNWLNRHNLEINEITLKVADISSSISNLKIDQVETNKSFVSLQLMILEKFSHLQNDLDSKLAALKSDQRQTTLIVSIVVGIIVYCARALANKWGF